jgi:hypothetical protein
LYCDGTAYSKERYPLLYETIFDTYAVPPDSILRPSAKTHSKVAFGNGMFVRTKPFACSTDGATWTDLTLHGSSNISPYAVIFANGMFVLVGYFSRNIYTYTSVDGRNWTSKASFYTGDGVTPESINIAYSNGNEEWVTYYQNTSDGTVIVSSTDSLGTLTLRSGNPFKAACIVCPVDGGWIAISNPSVYFTASIVDAFKYAYTINSVDVSGTTFYQAKQINGKCFAVFNGHLCTFDKDGYTVCSTGLSTGGRNSAVGHIVDKSSIILITPKVICTASYDGTVKMPVEHVVTHSDGSMYANSYDSGIISAAYGNNTIVFTTYNGTYSLDVTNFALPNQINANTYDYIKAE